MAQMGTKIRERATGQIWTVVGDTEGHSILQHDHQPPANRPKTYRLLSETGEEKLISSDFSARFEALS